jgi:hypothetical protein
VSSYYLVARRLDTQTETDLKNTLQIPWPYYQSMLQDGDYVLLMNTRNDSTNTILPYITKVKSAENRPLITLVVEHIYDRSVAENQVRPIVPRLDENKEIYKITSTQFDNLVQRMGELQPFERYVLDYIARYIESRGFYFDKLKTLYNYHICLKTRPFVILAGLSGTGKSKLSRLYAEAMGYTTRNNKHFLRLAVSPNWDDPHYLTGYLNTLTKEYVTEPALELILAAIANPDELYFLCLDEMNLARVEHYFAQFLSALEEEDPEERSITLFGEGAQKFLGANSRYVGPTVTIPANVLFTGTINVDETTHALSDKVIDRANTIDFFSVDLDQIPEPAQEPIAALHISASMWQSYQAKQPDHSYHQHTLALDKILRKADLPISPRVAREIKLYLANSKGLLEPQLAFDLQVMQRILPHMRGSHHIGPVLKDLTKFMDENNLTNSAERLIEMEARLKRDGYTTFSH